MDSERERRLGAERLRKARIAAGYDSPTDAARALGIPPPTYLGHENGTTKFTRKAALYAKKFNISLDYLVTGRLPKTYNLLVPVIAYVGAGAEVFPVDDHARGRGLEMVDPPAGLGDDCVAAKIRGDSMYPLRDGWLVFWCKDQAGVPEECIGQLCVVQVKDGPLLVKDLRKGSKKGLFSLESWNAPTREDVQLEWASKVEDIRCK
jgi:phage repressor protein C with HTH and peptisase S24 domain